MMAPARGTGLVVVNPTLVHETAVAMTRAMCLDRTICDQLIQLLIACGRLSVDSGNARPLHVVGAAMARFRALTQEVICAALVHSIENNEQHLEEVRRFFLRPQETYSVEELATLWEIHPDDVRDIYHDELSRSQATRGGEADARIAWADAVATSVKFSILRPFDVERALGGEFSHARPESWRTVPILVHLPRFIVEAVAVDHSIPPKLPIDIRLEQIILEVFASGEYSITARTSDDDPPLRVVR